MKAKTVGTPKSSTRRALKANVKSRRGPSIRERHTLAELAEKFEVSPVMISRWKKVDNYLGAFSS